MRKPTNNAIIRRALLAIVENFWDKYAVSSQMLEAERENTLKVLKGFLSDLGYYPHPYP